MVDKSQIPTANQMIAELGTIAQAIHNIDGQGRITSFVIGVPPPATPPAAPSEAVPAQVDARDMVAPPAMYDAIKAFLTQRQTSIRTQLSGMGITGVQ